jgi:hypothetical protein
MPTDYIVGLDLGQSQDYSAAVILQRLPGNGSSKAKYHCPAIKRWALGTSYVSIVADLEKQLAEPPLAGAMLVMDITGCGRPVYDMARLTHLASNLHGVLITGGAIETLHPNGLWHIAKTILISTTQVCLEQRRVLFADKLPETPIIVREMQGYRMRRTLQANEVYNSKDSDNDDILLALCLGLWAGERIDRMTPRIEILDNTIPVEPSVVGPDGMTPEQRERLPNYVRPEDAARQAEVERLLKMTPEQREQEQQQQLTAWVNDESAFHNAQELDWDQWF